MNLIFEQIRTGGDRNFAYLIGDREARQAWIVDPSYDPRGVVRRATDQGLQVEAIINTHGHSDHTNGNEKARKLTGAPVAAHPLATSTADRALADDETVHVGRFEIRVLHVPGHADDHLLLWLPEPKIAITGDLLFVGKIGGTGSDAAARTEYESLQRVLEELPDDATIWPGHDYGCRPSSTIALEKVTNPFLLVADIDGFLQLKSDWPRFKREHGLK